MNYLIKDVTDNMYFARMSQRTDRWTDSREEAKQYPSPESALNSIAHSLVDACGVPYHRLQVVDYEFPPKYRVVQGIYEYRSTPGDSRVAVLHVLGVAWDTARETWVVVYQDSSLELVSIPAYKFFETRTEPGTGQVEPRFRLLRRLEGDEIPPGTKCLSALLRDPCRGTNLQPCCRDKPGWLDMVKDILAAYGLGPERWRLSCK